MRGSITYKSFLYYPLIPAFSLREKEHVINSLFNSYLFYIASHQNKSITLFQLLSSYVFGQQWIDSAPPKTRSGMQWREYFRAFFLFFIFQA